MTAADPSLRDVCRAIDIERVGPGCRETVGGHRLLEYLVRVDRGDGVIGGAMDDHARDGAGEVPDGGVKVAALRGGVLAAARHRGKRGGHGGGGAVGEPRMHRDRGEQVRVDGSEDRGHRAARRQAGHEDPVGVDRPRRCASGDLADALDDRRRFAGPARLVLGQEPVPAALRVAAAVLLGIDHDEPVAVGRLVHPRRGREARRVLRAAVQHADERQGRSRARRRPAHGRARAGFLQRRRAAYRGLPGA